MTKRSISEDKIRSFLCETAVEKVCWCRWLWVFLSTVLSVISETGRLKAILQQTDRHFLWRNGSLIMVETGFWPAWWYGKIRKKIMMRKRWKCIPLPAVIPMPANMILIISRWSGRMETGRFWKVSASAKRSWRISVKKKQEISVCMIWRASMEDASISPRSGSIRLTTKNGRVLSGRWIRKSPAFPSCFRMPKTKKIWWRTGFCVPLRKSWIRKKIRLTNLESSLFSLWSSTGAISQKFSEKEWLSGILKIQNHCSRK